MEGGIKVSLHSALSLIRFFEEEGVRAWIVGGAVRDSLVGRSLSDVDVAVGCSGKEIKSFFPKAPEIGKDSKKTFVVFFDGEVFDVFPLYNKPLEEDLARRDFTVNAMALDSKGKIYDPFDGFSDLRRGILRFNGNPIHRLKDDPIRALRLCRFASALDLRIDEDSARAVKNFSSHIPHVSSERIGHEVLKAFEGDALLFFRFVRSHNLMMPFFPFLQKLSGQRVESTSSYEGDSLLHSFLSLQAAQNSRKDMAVQTAAFFQHVDSGFINELLVDWSWPSFLRGEIVTLIKNLPFFLEPLSDDRAVSMFDALGDSVVNKLFDLSFASLMASGESTDSWRENMLLYYRTILRLKCVDFLPNGEDLKKMLAIEEGPLIGFLKTGLRQAAAKGEIENKEEVEEWLWKNAPDRNKNIAEE